MDVLHYLKERLQNHNTVSIDGLGTLYKKKTPGKYDLEKHAFVPPQNSVGFSDKVNELDELSPFIANAENVTIDNAQLLINDFVANIKRLIENGQNVELQGLGKFSNVDQNLTFDSAEENIFGNEFFGFPTLNDRPHLNYTNSDDLTSQVNSPILELNEDDNELVTNSEVIPNITKPIGLEKKVPEVEIPRIVNDDEEDNDFDDEQSNGSRTWIKLLIILAIIAVIIGATYMLKPALFDSLLNKNTSNVENSEIAVPLDSTTYQSDTTIKYSVPNLDSTVVLIPITKPIDSNITTYEVIGSAEKSQKRIDQYILTMQKRGIEAKPIAAIPGKLIKISLGSFTDFSIAKKYQDSLRKKLNNPEIYIQTIKPKK